MPRFSIVVPVYNDAECIVRCLASICAQGMRDWECIVVNDGSTDSTVQSLTPSLERRIRFVDRPHFGVSAARNAALEMTSGEWVIFLDADDVLVPNALADAEALMKRKDPVAGGVYMICGERLVDGDSPIPSGTEHHCVQDLFFRTLGFERSAHECLLQNTVFHQSIFEARCHPFDTSLTTAEDRGFLINASAKSKALVTNLQVAIYHRGQGADYRSLVSGEKIRAHRQIYSTISASPHVRRRLSHSPSDDHRFGRLLQAYLHMLDAAEYLRAERDAAPSLLEMWQKIETSDELDGILNRFFYLLSVGPGGLAFSPSEFRKRIDPAVQTLARSAKGLLLAQILEGRIQY